MNDQELHKKVSVDCFNHVWQLLDKTSRSTEEDLMMREMAHASLFHWLRREDHTATNLSTGLWQISRVHFVLKEHDTALRYALECIEVSRQTDVFYLSCAHEAAARAYLGLGQPIDQLKHHTEALALLEKVENDANLSHLKADLAEVAPRS